LGGAIVVREVILIQMPGETGVLEGVTVEQVTTGRVVWIQTPEGTPPETLIRLAQRVVGLPLDDPRVVVVLPAGAKVMISTVEA
jgi:hypothetical protein